jgi:hypothetical protein
MDLTSVQASNRRPRFINGHTDDYPLVVPGVGSMSDHRLESDAATGQ